ncbi:DnaD domain-containing protein [Bacillus luteolus]|uniref:DnaD domain-containing protein n=1 Tax=Litchfieldia luteola TaxID=682179 RepID=A0ABR9QP21_9BACI|nr:DnaD domain-containing protein [Cytobacillus luteolus]MBE4910248.1 DnaD domain-containing protein [Cytobacillus luteolus]MBP1942180.1 DNA replication protein [Cytobacillus luteolus]
MNYDNFIDWFQQGSVAIPKLLLQNYKNLNLNEEEFMVVLQVLNFIESGNTFPTPTELSSNMTLSTTRCTEILRHLLQKGYLAIEEDYHEKSIIVEKYSLKPLWVKLFHYLMSETIEQEKTVVQREEQSLYTIFEQEFGRPLSPFECESLSMWIDQDHHDPIIIKAALREAVMSGKLNFRYIDRILFEWKKNGIQTIEQAQAHSKKFRQHSQKQKQVDQNTTKEYERTIPFYNWLES